MPEEDVLRHRKVGKERLLLEHHPDPLFIGLDRLGQVQFLPVAQDRPGVSFFNPHQYAHQGALAGAVFPDQPQDFAGIELQRNPLERLDAGKTFPDAAHGQDALPVVGLLHTCYAPPAIDGKPGSPPGTARRGAAHSSVGFRCRDLRAGIPCGRGVCLPQQRIF